MNRMLELKQITESKPLEDIAALFDGWDETMIWTALAGCMGSVWCIDAEHSVAMVDTSDFVFFAGDAASPKARALVQAFLKKAGNRNAIVTPQNELWETLLMELLGDRAVMQLRYAIRKDTSFDKAHLQGIVEALPEEFTLRHIDAQLYDLVMATEWACDFCSSFKSCKDFLENGIGVVALWEDEIVGGSSSYIYYPGGIEVEVDTRSDMRRRGIALACSAQLILSCLERGLYPSWDAANLMSVGLAEKLGYEQKSAYTILELNP